MDEEANRFIKEASNQGDEIHIIAHRRRSSNEPKEYARKLAEQQEFNRVPKDLPVLFLEVDVEDASEFEDVMEVRGVEVGDYKVLRAESAVVPNAIAAFLLYLRDETGGSIAQQFAADRPELVRRLILAGTACRLGPMVRDAMRRHAQLAAWGQYRRSAAALAPTITGSALGQRLAGAAMWLAAPLGGMGPYWDPSDMIATVEAEDAFDASDRLGEIRAPTLVIGGERDPFIEGYVFLT